MQTDLALLIRLIFHAELTLKATTRSPRPLGAFSPRLLMKDLRRRRWMRLPTEQAEGPVEEGAVTPGVEAEVAGTLMTLLTL